jgi:ribonuclease HI
MNNGGANVKAGAGIFYGVDDPRNRALRIPDKLRPSNNVGELVAIKHAVEACPLNTPLSIYTDSQISINALTKHLAKSEDEGFLTTANGPLVRAIVSKLRRRRAKTTITWVKGHAGNAGNEAADRLADEGCQKPTPDEMDCKADSRFLLPGAKLQAMSQSKAYKIMQLLKRKKPAHRKLLDRKRTRQNLRLAQEAVADASDDLPSEEAIWKSTRHKDLSRSVRHFLWMMLHGGYKVGDHWTKIPGHEEKATCNTCGVTETMTHILTKCEAPGQKEIWELASELWVLKTGDVLPPPTIGQIMGCAAIKRQNAGTTRLSRIIFSESAHLIWRIRNERVIQERPTASEREIYNRWCKSINSRLEIDCALTNALKYGKKAIPKALVLETWHRVLKNEESLPKDWTWETGVLVGIG